VGSAFDRRVVPDEILGLVRACQDRVPSLVVGGAVLGGVHLAHRLSDDVDLAHADPEALRELVRQLPDVAAQVRLRLAVVRDAGTFVRVQVEGAARSTRLDLTVEPLADGEAPPQVIEGVRVASLPDLRASKLTCLLSRSEPRDLVDVCFLDRAGMPPERDLAAALRKDTGIDPGVLAWLLRGFPVRPLPEMLVPFDEAALREYRDGLAARLRRLAVPG